ncbi:hypothetical protein GO986_19105 [Deinococcus sp. HMF7620]|uniref:Uncharacterized protein n=1 Tax=Deinococcus arboris TaxID=2682977 RepID=A0A7C9HTT6_9DEIO|nr:hypothetical protein [Deinococcus arboris]MVN88853.1 hypothetical protein [Deinococcus arboris]
MKAYKGVVENGVVVVIGGRLPEGTVVTVTVGEGELLRARITNVLKRPRKVRVRLKPTPGLAVSGAGLDAGSPVLRQDGARAADD